MEMIKCQNCGIAFEDENHWSYKEDGTIICPWCGAIFKPIEGESND